MPLMFESLEVYKKAMAFVVAIFDTCVGIPDRGIKDQLKRAALSIQLNIAEGNGRAHAKEKRQFFRTARGSLLECVPILQLIHQMKLIENGKYGDLYTKAEEIGKMLSGLIKSVENRK